MKAKPHAVTPPSTTPAARVRGLERARVRACGWVRGPGRAWKYGSGRSRARNRGVRGRGADCRRCAERRARTAQVRSARQRRRRRTGSSRRSSAAPFAVSSISGVANSAPRVSPRALPWWAIRKSLAQPFAMIATVVAAKAPQARQNRVCRSGTRAVWLSQANAPSTNGSGSIARPMPTSSPVVPVCRCTSCRISAAQPARATAASAEERAGYRSLAVRRSRLSTPR